MKQLSIILGLAAVAISNNSFAIGNVAKELQHQWDVTKYQTVDDKREDAFKQLAEHARQVAQQHPNDAEVLVWEAIIISTYAGEKGGLGALSLVKEAKAELEKAERIKPDVLDGSVYTSLGSLYYQVPGWPVGFGDDDKALSYLSKALQINPNGMDPNYFYGDFMMEEGEYQKAVSAFEKALNAAPRADRPIADEGRKQEIELALAKAKKHLN